MLQKTIFKGRLEFGNARSFEKAKQTHLHLMENLYKNDLLLKEPEIFEEETFCMNITHTIVFTMEKTWKNTVSILEKLSEFAVSGSVWTWMTDEANKPIRSALIEPKGDKAAVQAYLHGKSLVKEEGKELDAVQALTLAIEKYERHALAYERRGYVNILLKNYKDALYDFNKSIDFNPTHADAYYGRGRLKMMMEDWEGAEKDLAIAMKQSIPLQPMYWQARRVKGECNLILKEYDKAIFEYKFFVKREFSISDPNYKWRKHAMQNYGVALLEKGDVLEAIKMFNAAGDILEGRTLMPKAEQLYYRGVALKRAGKSEYIKCLKESASLGYEKARAMMVK
jgi:tetratricopeptide (TPR) repeat protein